MRRGPDSARHCLSSDSSFPEIPLSSQIECPHRKKVRSQGDLEFAECRVLCQITGIANGPHVTVRQDACEACCRDSLPSENRLNPVTASLLHRLCKQVVALDGVEECDIQKAERLQKWAYNNLPLVASKSNPLGPWRGYHHTLCSQHSLDEEDSSVPCIHLTRSLTHVIGQAYHRSGWPYAVRSLIPLFCKRGILFDDFVEQHYCYSSDPPVYTTPWVGIFHHPGLVPEFLGDRDALENILKGAAWEESEKHLRGAIALSDHVARYLSTRLQVPVVTIKHPSEIPGQTWSEEAFLRCRPKKLVQLGWYLRNTRAVYQLPSLAHYDKIRCRPEKPWIAEYDRRIADHWISRGTRTESSDVVEIGYVPNEQYDSLLASCVVFTELFEASANNVVIECIARNTPILINRHPAAVEYLTPDYPLFFDDIDEVSELLAPEQVLAAHRYLRDMKKDWLNGENFCNSICDALKTMDLARPMPVSQPGIKG